MGRPSQSVTGATGAVLYLNLRLVSSANGALLARFAGGIAFLVLLTWGVNYSQQENFNSSPEYQATLKAPFWKVSGSRTTEEFFKQGEAMLDALDKERGMTDRALYNAKNNGRNRCEVMTSSL